jgi:hypothetical protein
MLRQEVRVDWGGGGRLTFSQPMGQEVQALDSVVSSHLQGPTVVKAPVLNEVKDQRPLPLIPCASRRGFERTGRTHRMHPTAFGAGMRSESCQSRRRVSSHPLACDTKSCQ